MGRFAALTDREWEVLELIAQGKMDQEIAQELFISDTTASKHVHHILRKLGVPNRTMAAALYWQHMMSLVQLENA